MGKVIPTTFCKKLIDSYGQRCDEVIQYKGNFFFSLYIDLTRIYDAFLNFLTKAKMYIFCFFQFDY